MKILVLGATGMLGQALMREGKKRGVEICGAAPQGTDFSLDVRDDFSLINTVNVFEPDVIINTVAIINLTICEKDPGLAYLVNSRPSSILADISKKKGIYLVHISSDHFYIGDGDKKHSELDSVQLVNEYARTKYVAEAFSLTSSNSLVVRTNIVGFSYQKNNQTLVEWVIGSLRKNLPITLFNDFYTSSIDVRQFSKYLFDLINKQVTGLLNLASSEVFSKEAFIKNIAMKLGSDSYPFKKDSVLNLAGVRRAESLGLDVSKAEKLLECKLPNQEMVVENLMLEYIEKRT